MQRKTLFSLSLLMVVLLSACAGLPQPQADVPEAAAEATVAPTPEAAAEATVAPVQPVVDAARIEFQPNSTRWHANGDLDPGESFHLVVAVASGQQLNIWLHTTPESTNDNLLATLEIRGADGQALNTAPTTYWSGVVSPGQDYFIEIRSLAQEYITFQIVVEIPAAVIDPALGAVYGLIPESVCLELRDVAAQALGIEFYAQTPAPFLDALGGEAGQGCSISARGDGTQFSSPQDVVATLVNSVGVGWTEQLAYQADGPTGSSTAMARDMALMLISAEWQPAMGVVCPADQPIADCDLTPEQKEYRIEIDIAEYNAAFSLDGQWEDTATNFNLELYQEWKTIYGNHAVVAQGGDKIDALDVSIEGSLQGKVATVQFKSAFTNDTGTAQITFVDVNTIQWKIIDPPDGEHYLPAEATLTRR